jgi:hypothetical protein
MIVRTTEEITDTDRQVDADHWTSKRIILSDDPCRLLIPRDHCCRRHPDSAALPRLRRSGLADRGARHTTGP